MISQKKIGAKLILFSQKSASKPTAQQPNRKQAKFLEPNSVFSTHNGDRIIPRTALHLNHRTLREKIRVLNFPPPRQTTTQTIEPISAPPRGVGVQTGPVERRALRRIVERGHDVEKLEIFRVGVRSLRSGSCEFAFQPPSLRLRTHFVCVFFHLQNVQRLLEVVFLAL